MGVGGEYLYNQFRFKMADEGLVLDHWQYLSDAEQSAWESFADFLETQGWKR